MLCVTEVDVCSVVPRPRRTQSADWRVVAVGCWRPDRCKGGAAESFPQRSEQVRCERP